MFAKAQPKPNCCQTYVVMATAGQVQSKVFLAYAQGEQTRGAGAFVLREKAGVLHLVITFAEECDFQMPGAAHQRTHLKDSVLQV